MANPLSGSTWWHTYQATYPNSSSVDDLEPGFRARVEDFIGSLRRAGASVRVSSTRRDRDRAYLMHYAWQVSHCDISPADVPKRGSVPIEWDHGDVGRSRDAATEMVKLFGMAHIAALNSNHIAGKAIDMTINWQGELVLTKPAPLLARINSQPRNGQNTELHRLGTDVFGVKKLVSDPPHWSVDGH